MCYEFSSKEIVSAQEIFLPSKKVFYSSFTFTKVGKCSQKKILFRRVAGSVQLDSYYKITTVEDVVLHLARIS